LTEIIWNDTKKCKPKPFTKILFACDNGEVYQGFMHWNGWYYDYGQTVAAPIEAVPEINIYKPITLFWAENPKHPNTEG
jgi:hypothetical protein